MLESRLTPSSLSANLEAVASAKSEKACGEALVAAAFALQNAVLTGQAPDSFIEAVDSCPDALREQLAQVVDRAVNFHPLDEGGFLGLWLLPVTISSAAKMPVEIGLETQSLNYLKMAGCLQQQFGFSGASTDRRGWVYLIPALYESEHLQSADLSELIRLPHQARNVVRGVQESFQFMGELAENEPSAVTGTNQFFLPVVVYHPAATDLTMPQPSSRTLARMANWFVASVTGKLSVTDYDIKVAQQPSPFSVAIQVGDRQLFEVKVRQMIAQVCDKAAVHPNAMAALVAPYAVRQADGQLILGVSLVSRLTKSVLATMSLPVESEDGSEEVALVSYLLREMGMEHIQRQAEPIGTFACQHCGNLQYSMPSPEVAFKGLAAEGSGVH